MAFTHARVYYGKYLDDISTLIDPEHYIVEEFSEIGHEVEPGEPNIPSSDEVSITLANLDPEGNQRYPYSFWRDARRTPEEGGTLAMEIFFRVEVGGQTEFIGVYDSVSYGIRDEKVTISIKDLLNIFKDDQREMLKTFELTGIEAHRLAGANDPDNYNLLGDLTDHVGNSLTHEAITFQLISQQRTTRGADRVVTNDPAIDFSHPWLSHVGLRRGEEIDITRNMYVQIGDTTLFTRCRYWSEVSTAGRNTSNFVYLTIYHSKEDLQSGVIPRGRFFADDDLTPIEEGDTVNLFIHDYSVPDPVSGSYFTDDVVVRDVDIPAYKNFIFGCSYVEDGGDIQLSTERYSYFDVVEATLRIFENYFAERFGSGGREGTIEVLSDASSAAGTGSKATFEIDIISSPPEQVSFVIIPGSDYWESALIDLAEGESITSVRTKIIDAINQGPSGASWLAQAGGPDIICQTDINRADFNGFDPITNPLQIANDIISMTTVSGGAFDEISGGINVKIGNDVDVTTAAISSGASKATIATAIKDALEADSNFNAAYTASIDGAVVTVSLSGAGDKVEIEVDPGSTGVAIEVNNLINSYDLFDLSKLIERNRYAFYSDVIFFGWIDKDIAEVLVGVAWQTTCYLYTTSEGKIALHSRDWYEENIDDVYIDAGSYSQQTLLDQDLEPTSGIEREDGFQSYSLKHPIDIIELNNVATDQERTIIAGGLEVVKEVEIISRDGGTQIVEQTSRYPAAKNQKLKTSNFRIHDLGVPSQNNITEDAKILRLSPLDPAWPHLETIEDFLPTPRTQLYRFYNSFKWPVETVNVETERNIYPNVSIGDYIALENLNLYLVKNLSVAPGPLTLQLTLEFKQGLINESITWDATDLTFDSTEETFDHT